MSSANLDHSNLSACVSVGKQYSCQKPYQPVMGGKGGEPVAGLQAACKERCYQ